MWQHRSHRYSTQKKGLFLKIMLLLIIGVAVLVLVVGRGWLDKVPFAHSLTTSQAYQNALQAAREAGYQIVVWGQKIGFSIDPNLVGQLKPPPQQEEQTASSTGVVGKRDKPVDATSSPAFKFALVADSHSENSNLMTALKIAKDQGVEFVIGLGDYTKIGTITELVEAKKIFDDSGLTYHLVPGDHDLWDSRDKEKDKATANFEIVFGKPYQSFTWQQATFLMIDNSDNYLGVSPEQLQFIKDQLDVHQKSGRSLLLVFIHEPLYHQESKHIMGRVNEELADQAQQLIKLLADYDVSRVFAGDLHFFGQFTEPQHNVKMTTIGALAAERNIQEPRFAIVSVMTDDAYQVQDREIND